jgi:cardiolipin synthase
MFYKKYKDILIKFSETNHMMIKYMTRFANVIALLVLFQALFFLSLVYGLQRIYFPLTILLVLLSVLCALFIATSDSHPVFRLAWVLSILLLPIFGGVIYVFYNRRKIDRLVERSHSRCLSRALQYEHLPEQNRQLPLPDTDRLICTYLKNSVGFSPAVTQNCVYFPVGEEKIAYLMDAVNKAEKYIFLEYFIIEEGLVWDSIREILARKAAQGVDVRLICDGAGCLYPLPWRFVHNMSKLGIKVKMFNPVRPFVSARINSRNHRKIASIDGKVAFCCGLNIADQYANVKQMYGHWKDSGVMVDGGTAWNMTLLFLSMWEFVSKGRERVDYSEFMPHFPQLQGDSYAGVMLDIPKDRITVSEHMFINFISRAQKYVYMTTPYFMCSSEILSAMYAAARSGVDVRIITPYVADKKVVKAVTESYYRSLIKNHVRVFEYLPGFIHAKNMIADGQRAMIGTVNLDYRSLYLHYECGITLHGGKIVQDIDEDFKKTLSQCKEITLEELDKVSTLKRGLQRASRLLAPFL